MKTILDARLAISSPAFREGEVIPAKYTCRGEDINPAINVKDVPEDSKSLVMVVEDPDAPGGMFDHWLIWNIKPWIEQISENIAPGVQGINDFNKKRYNGPCPPDGQHRYFFRLYALDRTLDLQEGAGKSDLYEAMEGHVLAEGSLMGRFG